MPDEPIDGGSANPEEGAAPNHDEVLEAALKERLGPDASLDMLDKYAKDEGGWLRAHNEKQQSLSAAEREASERAAQLAEQAAQHQMMTAQTANPGPAPQGPLTPQEAMQVFGASDPDQVASVGQLAQFYATVDTAARNIQQGTLAELESRDQKIEKLEGMLDKLDPFLDSYYNDLASKKYNEVMQKYPRAYGPAVQHAIQTLEAGPDFEQRLEQVAADSHREVLRLGKEAALEEAKELRAKNERFRGEGGVAAIVSSEHPKPQTGSGVTDFDRDFAAKTWVAPDGGDDI